MMSLDELIKGASREIYRNSNYISCKVEHVKVKVPSTSRSTLAYLGESSHRETEDQYVTVDHSIKSWSQARLLSKTCSCPKEFIRMFVDALRWFEENLVLNQEATMNDRFQRFLYQACGYLLGSEIRIQSNRIFYEVMDDCLKTCATYTNVSSGSQAEGINVVGGDIDIMTILDKVVVGFENCKDILDGNCNRQIGTPHLYLDTNDSYPGFVKLRIADTLHSNDLLKCWGTVENGIKLISNKRFKEFFMRRYRDKDIKIHGPCISNKSGSVDHLFCLKLNTWPKIANTWLVRSESSAWPSLNSKSRILRKSVLLVPIGSKFGGHQDCSTEWRMSFSLSEKELVSSFNHTQFLCYSGFKEMIKHVRRRHCIPNLVYCSYFLKITLFWLCEELPQDAWHCDNILVCFKEIQKRLMYWIRYKFCPHYFIPENNLFEGLLDDQRQIVTEMTMGTLLLMFSQKFSVIPWLDNLTVDGLYQYTIKGNKLCEQTKAILTSVSVLRSHIRLCSYKKVSAIGRKCVLRLTIHNHSFVRRGVYILSFCYVNQFLAQQIPLSDNRNKESYRKRKQVLSRLLLGSKSDAVSGWLLLASYFYQIKSLNFCMTIIDLLVQPCRRREMITLKSADYVFKHVNLDIPVKKEHFRSFLHLMKYSVVDLVYFAPFGELMIEELNDLMIEFCKMPAMVFAQFLQFLCFHKLKMVRERNTCLENMIKKNRIQSEENEDIEMKLFTYAILEKAYRVIDDYKAAKYWYNHVIRYWRRHERLFAKIGTMM